MEIAGIDVGERWQDLGEHLVARAHDTVLPFLSMQYLYGLARAGRVQAEYARSYRMLWERHWWWRSREALVLSSITTSQSPGKPPRTSLSSPSTKAAGGQGCRLYQRLRRYCRCPRAIRDAFRSRLREGFSYARAQS